MPSLRELSSSFPQEFVRELSSSFPQEFGLSFGAQPPQQAPTQVGLGGGGAPPEEPQVVPYEEEPQQVPYEEPPESEPDYRTQATVPGGLNAQGRFDVPPPSGALQKGFDAVGAGYNAAVDLVGHTVQGLYDYGASLWKLNDPTPLIVNIAKSNASDWEKAEKLAAEGEYAAALGTIVKFPGMADQGFAEGAGGRAGETLGNIGVAIGKAHWDTLMKSRQLFKEGRIPESYAYATAAVLPLAGPGLISAGQRFSDGEISFMSAFGEATGLLAPFAGRVGAAGRAATAEQIAAARQFKAGIPGVVSGPPASPIPATKLGAVEAFADRRDIPMTIGQRLGDSAIQSAEQLSEKTGLLASTAGRNKRIEQAAAMERAGRNIADEIHPEPASTGSAGEAARQAVNTVDRSIEKAYQDTAESISRRVHPEAQTAHQAGEGVFGQFKTKMEALTKLANEEYSEWRALVRDPKQAREVVVGYEESKPVSANVPEWAKTKPAARREITETIQLPLDLKPMKRDLVEVYTDIIGNPEWTLPRRQNSPAFTAIEQLVTGPDVVSIEQAEKMLSAVKALARSEGGVAKRAVSRLEHAIDYANKQAGPEFVKALEGGRAATQKYYAAEEVVAKLKGDPVRRGTVVEMRGEAAPVPARVLGSNDTTLKLLKRVVEEVPGTRDIVARTYLDDLFTPALDGGFDFSRANAMARKWNTLGAEEKAILYDPGVRRQLDLLFEQARKVSARVDPELGKSAVGAFDSLVLPRDTGYERLAAVGKVAPKVPSQIGRAWFEQALTQMFEQGDSISHGKKALNDWNRLGEKSKRAMFKDNVENVDAFFNLAANVSYHANPSQTAFVSAVGYKLWNPIRAVFVEVPQWAFTKAMWDPRFTKAAVAAMKTPRKATRASGEAAGRVFNILRDSGYDVAAPGLLGAANQRREDAAATVPFEAPAPTGPPSAGVPPPPVAPGPPAQ